MGTADLVLKAACDACGSASQLYGTVCRHATLCSSCAAAMARSRALCNVCAAPIINVIREYNVRVDTAAEKALSIGKFNTGLPPLSKIKGAENKWSLRKDGPLQGRQLTADMREKYYNRKPWILEDDTGEHQYQSQLEASQSATATYYLLIRLGKEFDAVPVGSWYNFSKIAQYKQLTLEEAEEKMSRRRSNATGYERWMMKTATHGAAAFGSDLKNLDDANGKAAGGVKSKKENSNEDGNHSDKGEEDEEEGPARKTARGLTTRGVEEEEEGGKEDFDLEDEIEMGDDWEHEEVFTDDDEALDPEERSDLADTENPTQPDIKQDDDENEQGIGGGLSKSGKELKKLLRRVDGQSESDDEDDKDADEDESPLSVLAPKLEDQLGNKPQENNTAKLTATERSVGTPPASRSNQKKRSGGDGAKTSNHAAVKKPKIEPETKTLGVKEEPSSSLEPISKASASTGNDTNTSAITEEEILRVLRATTPVKTHDFVARFKPRFSSQEDKDHFGAIVKRFAVSVQIKGVNCVDIRKEYK